MTTRARAYRATHAPEQELKPALPELRDAAEKHAGLRPDTLQEVATRIQLPIATLRGAASSFDESKSGPGGIKVCAGTSCMLAGGGDLSRELSRDHHCHPAYCLGYCDRSPAAMTAGGRVVPDLTREKLALLGSDTPHPHPHAPSVRCTARSAIVTARLMGSADPRGAAPEYTGLRAALRMSPEEVVGAILASGLRGRGGAAYPTGRKWQLAARAAGGPKFVVANGDEGDPGSFIDRELMERDPHSILEGMAICGHAVGASRGIVFIRSEYPVSADVMACAIDAAVRAGSLGANALGKGRPFDVEIVKGLGSYVCGEETALLAAIEGQRGEVWPRPPYPVDAGVFGKPTVVDNVETLNNVPWILEHGSGAYGALGGTESKGTKALCFDHGFAKPGIVEVEFGVTLRSAIEDLAGGGRDGAELEAVLLGGPMGSIVTPDQWDAPICFTGMSRRGITLGHAGLVAIPKHSDWNAILRHLLTFMRDESCGKCVPCRMGSLRAHDLAKSGLNNANLPQFRRIMALMKDASLCAFGRETPGPVVTAIEKFGDRIFTEVRS